MMGGGGSFLSLLSIAVFLACAWLATKISRAAGVSSIVLEITTGVLLGPSVFKLVAPEYVECQQALHIDCRPPPNLAQLIAEGRPLGEGLDMIAHMEGVCSAYAPRVEGPSGSTDVNDTQSSNDTQTTTTSGSSGDVESTTRRPCDPNARGGAETVAGHVGEHGEEDEEDVSKDEVERGPPCESRATESVAGHVGEHGEEDGAAESGREGGSRHRRLSRVRSYKSYEQCLVKQCEAEVARQCQETPDFFTLIGHAGVALMIFESGLHFDLDKAGEVGSQACSVALFGTMLPVMAGALLTVIFGRPLMPDGMAVGTVLAPTSVGIALRMLGEAKVLQEDFGQAIITAAFLDDLFSLVLFDILFSMGGTFNVFSTVVSPILGLVFTAIAMYLAVKVWPYVINEVILPRVPTKEGAKVSPQDEVIFFMMVVLLVSYATLTHFLGTHLWGCFMAGITFACVDKEQHAQRIWVKQTKRATSWMIRIFFVATLAFSIPVDKLLSFDAFLKGSLLGMGPCILGKVFCAPFMGEARFVVGWAMVGRAEFAYLIAHMAAEAGLMDEATFSMVLWALLYATVFAPFFFRKVLDKYLREHCLKEGLEAARKDNSDLLAVRG